MFENASRDQLRETYRRAWLRRLAGEPLTPLETQIAEVVAEHPEYHSLLEQPDAGRRDFAIASGEANPFLHLGMHLALREQVTTDRPAGIATLHGALCRRHGDRQAAEHAMMDCLGEALWRAQRERQPPDETSYLACLRRQLTTVIKAPG